eukprot:gene1940-33351_t
MSEENASDQAVDSNQEVPVESEGLDPGVKATAANAAGDSEQGVDGPQGDDPSNGSAPADSSDTSPSDKGAGEGGGATATPTDSATPPPIDTTDPGTRSTVGQDEPPQPEQTLSPKPVEAKPKKKPISTGEAAVLETNFVDALAGQKVSLGASPSVGGFKMKQMGNGTSASVTVLPDVHASRAGLTARTRILRSTYPQSHQRSQMGTQVDSNKRSEPTAKFGKGSRFQDKVFISSAHSSVLPPPGMPGPGTYNVIRQLTKPDMRYLKKKGGHDTSSSSKLPAMDGSSQTIGSKVDMANDMRGFGSEPRFHIQNQTTKMLSKNPGPGEYRLNTPQQHLSTSHMGVAIKFQKGQRKKQPSKGFEQEFYGTLSPGPIYKPGYKHQLQGGSTGFGKGQRTVDPSGKVPTLDEIRAAQIPGKVLTPDEIRAAQIPGPNVYKLKDPWPFFLLI